MFMAFTKSFLLKITLVLSICSFFTFFWNVNFVKQAEGQGFRDLRVEAVSPKFSTFHEDILDDRDPSNLAGYPIEPLTVKEARMCDDKLQTTYKDDDAFLCPDDPTCVQCNTADVKKITRIKDTFLSQENEMNRAELFDRVFPVGKPVVLMAVNEGQMYLFMNWLCSCQKNGIDPTKFTYMIPTDESSYDVLTKYGFYVEPITWIEQSGIKIQSGYDGRANLGGHSIINSVAVLGVNSLLQKNYPVLYSDVDLVWFKNPLPFLFHTSQQKDILAMYSRWHGATGPINSGFIYIRPSFKSKIFIRTLVNLTVVKKRSDQQLWNKALRHPKFRQLVFRSLPDRLFNLYYFHHKPPLITNETFVMHVLSVQKAPRLDEYGHWYFTKSCQAFDEDIDNLARTEKLYEWPEKPLIEQH